MENNKVTKLGFATALIAFVLAVLTVIAQGTHYSHEMEEIQSANKVFVDSLAHEVDIWHGAYEEAPEVYTEQSQQYENKIHELNSSLNKTKARYADTKALVQSYTSDTAIRNFYLDRYASDNIALEPEFTLPVEAGKMAIIELNDKDLLVDINTIQDSIICLQQDRIDTLGLAVLATSMDRNFLKTSLEEMTEKYEFEKQTTGFLEEDLKRSKKTTLGVGICGGVVAVSLVAALVLSIVSAQ